MWDGGRAGAVPSFGAFILPTEEPISCPHQGTQAQPSATEGLFWELARGEVTRGLKAPRDSLFPIAKWGALLGGGGGDRAPTGWLWGHGDFHSFQTRTLHGKKSLPSATEGVTWGTHGSVPLYPQPQDSDSWPLAKTEKISP